MVPFPARRADDPEPLHPDPPSFSPIEPAIEELASRLAAQGIQSTELLLDLVLHDLAEETRQAVNATGAAIALERDGELICRAAAGSTVPDLGVRIHTQSGLSGICVQQGTTQICSNTETDDRVDTEACRRLGVRSIAVLPLFSAGRVVGVLEAFSAGTNAFSSDDVRRLEALALTIALTVKTTREKRALSVAPTEAVNLEPPSKELSVASVMQKVSLVDPAVKVLRWLVIGLAIPLIILIGFEWGWHRAQAPARQVSTRINEKPEQPASSASALPGKKPSLPTPPKNNPAGAKPATDLGSQGGLVIYQNGRVIYREPATAGPKQSNSHPSSNTQQQAMAAQPTPTRDSSASTGTDGETPADASTSVPSDVTGGRLVHSIHPKYPAEAILRKLAGPVVLHGIITQDGAIRDLKLVRGDPILAAAALEAVQQWKYEPYRRHGVAVAMPIDITIDFNLPD